MKGSRSLRIKNITRGGHRQLPGAKKGEALQVRVSGKTGQVTEAFTLVSPKKRAAQGHARPSVL